MTEYGINENPPKALPGGRLWPGICPGNDPDAWRQIQRVKKEIFVGAVVGIISIKYQSPVGLKAGAATFAVGLGDYVNGLQGNVRKLMLTEVLVTVLSPPEADLGRALQGLDK